MIYLCKSGCGNKVSGKDRNCWKCANSGSNNPAWQGGKAKEKYKGFDRQIKKEIRFRDKYTCQVCGKKQIGVGKNKEDQLEVHHIDYEKTHTIHSNLISLCKDCHIKTNFNREYYQVFFINLLKSRGIIK